VRNSQTASREAAAESDRQQALIEEAAANIESVTQRAVRRLDRLRFASQLNARAAQLEESQRAAEDQLERKNQALAAVRRRLGTDRIMPIFFIALCRPSRRSAPCSSGSAPNRKSSAV
jgi:hypothetical protein